jgi:hypothetical protein
MRSFVVDYREFMTYRHDLLAVEAALLHGQGAPVMSPGSWVIAIPGLSGGA